MSSPSSRRWSCDSGAVFCRFAEKSGLFMGSKKSSKLHRSRSCDSRKSQIRRALTACLNSFSDDDDTRFENGNADSSGEAKFLEIFKPFDGLEAPDFPKRDEIIPANIERKANSVEIPLSLRMIKRKKQWQEGVIEAGESAYCSVKKAFSSMVFIIRELHSFTLQMREVLFFQDLQGILASVQREMNASFVWLFQNVFAHTPTLMVYVMILLANFSVYSMSSNAAIAAVAPILRPEVVTEQVSAVEDESIVKHKFDSSIVKSLTQSPSNGKTASVGGNNSGGGGKFRPVVSGTDGFDESNYYNTVAPDGVSLVGRASGDESVSFHEEESALWDSIEEEAS
ncbi:hypothetical protein CDL12_21909 [Handroanthus impetiginosus]|uniref:Uncharacterized protein n=1 Tax=Handroanthus impetiginosus TaxID=429701 RepID=A0A2G9GKJ1_9LAMI|nr:hypothetical protein CDL12_21909 [Handroanthus impetiginosus]